MSVQFDLKGQGVLHAVDGIDLDIQQGEILGLVGESGCGKMVTTLSILRLIDPPGHISNGQLNWEGKDLLNLNHKDMRQVRGKEIAMIFQNPQSSMNPLYSVGSQLVSVIRLHQKISKEEARKEAIRLLRLVEIPDPGRRMNDYPHQLSGGMCQRVMIAMALSCRPKLLVADEPTASLDVTIQAQIMDLLLEIREKFQMAILLVSHDLGVIAKMCDRISVMYLGRIVEEADAATLFRAPGHPYTKALLSSVLTPDPRLGVPDTQLGTVFPNPIDPPSGCSFHPRCAACMDICREQAPQPQINGAHMAECHLDTAAAG